MRKAGPLGGRVLTHQWPLAAFSALTRASWKALTSGSTMAESSLWKSERKPSLQRTSIMTKVGAMKMAATRHDA
jgi:hypothetical protein